MKKLVNRNIFDRLVQNKVLRPIVVTLYVLIKRAIPIMAFAILLGLAAYMLDRHNVRQAPGEDFVNYYSFDVQNSREGEDVFFKVCRTHDELYHYDGGLTVYVYKNDDTKAKPVKVYARDITGNLQGDCENKVLKTEDFYHNPGTYKMAFCINFTVKYDIAKNVCKDSNIYKIYPQPSDINSRLRFYEQQLKILRKQLKESDSDKEAAPSSMAVPEQSTTPSSSSSSAKKQPSQSSDSNVPDPNPTPTNPTPDPEPVTECRVNLLGLCLFTGVANQNG